LFPARLFNYALLPVQFLRSICPKYERLRTTKLTLTPEIINICKKFQAGVS
jgi:hypothetical protein